MGSQNGSLQEGYLQVKSEQPLTGFLLVEEEEALHAISFVKASEAQVLWSPHFFVSDEGTTEVRLLNTGTQPLRSSITVFDDSGTTLGAGSVRIGGREMLVRDLTELAGIQSQIGEVKTGFFRILIEPEGFSGAADNTEIVASMSFTDGIGYLSTVPLTAESGTNILLPHVAQSRDLRIFTGVTILNAGEEAANVIMTARTASGEQAAEISFLVSPQSRQLGLLDEAHFFGSGFEQTGGSLSLQSDQPIVVQAFFGGFSLDYMSAIQPWVN